ncbi:hypothetical protein SISNIDRAFT_467901 [Sistotremastrum niveocremeum HHB9708]|uniref:Uncharacterized protein n=1 Tax=Sistotremastrum niveocremeum HHB9708 TaxID=1314777 RepID=A0A164SBU8_9AGAM|nr:hypothetical protein SISNIDRAFT_467901 [Sistotremastrum niveocremeum HHB9708]
MPDVVGLGVCRVSCSLYRWAWYRKNGIPTHQRKDISAVLEMVHRLQLGDGTLDSEAWTQSCHGWEGYSRYDAIMTLDLILFLHSHGTGYPDDKWRRWNPKCSRSWPPADFELGELLGWMRSHSRPLVRLFGAWKQEVSHMLVPGGRYSNDCTFKSRDGNTRQGATMVSMSESTQLDELHLRILMDPTNAEADLYWAAIVAGYENRLNRRLAIRVHKAESERQAVTTARVTPKAKRSHAGGKKVGTDSREKGSARAKKRWIYQWLENVHHERLRKPRCLCAGDLQLTFFQEELSIRGDAPDTDRVEPNPGVPGAENGLLPGADSGFKQNIGEPQDVLLSYRKRNMIALPGSSGRGSGSSKPGDQIEDCGGSSSESAVSPSQSQFAWARQEISKITNPLRSIGLRDRPRPEYECARSLDGFLWMTILHAVRLRGWVALEQRAFPFRQRTSGDRMSVQTV